MAVPRVGERMGQPVFLAEVRRNGFREFMEGQMRQLSGGKQPLRIAESLEGWRRGARPTMLLPARDGRAVTGRRIAAPRPQRQRRFRRDAFRRARGGKLPRWRGLRFRRRSGAHEHAAARRPPRRQDRPRQPEVHRGRAEGKRRAHGHARRARLRRPTHRHLLMAGQAGAHRRTRLRLARSHHRLGRGAQESREPCSTSSSIPPTRCATWRRRKPSWG